MEDYKAVFICRNDINMRKGKLAAQVGHAVMQLMMLHLNGIQLEYWKESGYKKIVVGGSIDEINAAHDKLLNPNVDCPYSLVFDDGLTEVEPATLTCLAVGPAPGNLVDEITGNYKLL
jgi:PTH2 family peptidyl-tRNA hydrolase